MSLFVAVTLYAWAAIYLLEQWRIRRLARTPDTLHATEARSC